MRHVIVSRVTRGLTVLFVVSAGLFALVVSSRPAPVPVSPADTSPPPASATVPAPDGRTAFADRCGGCHDAADLASAVQTSRASVDTFLRTHGGAAPEERRPILDFLASR